MKFIRRFTPLLWIFAFCLENARAAAPVITGFSPRSGTNGVQVVISGMNFLDPQVTQVSFGGGLETASILSQSDRSLRVVVPPMATIGQIEVDNADGTIFTTNNFIAGAVVTNFVRQTPAPTSDADGVTGKPGDVVFIEGINFEDLDDAGFGISVYFGGVRATTFETRGTTALVATIPALAVTGPILVINNGGGVGTVTNFFIPPIVTSFTPRGTIGSTNRIVGRSFVGVTAVSFGGVPADSFAIVGGTNILAIVPSNAPTSGAITVSAPGGDFITSTPFLLLPLISGFSPAGGAEGTAVTLQGSGFTGANRVLFGGIAATPTSISAGAIKVAVPRGGLTGPLAVVTPNGTNTSSITFYVAPSITDFNPNQATANQLVTITGRNFTGATSVGFSNAVTTAFKIVSDSSITVNVPSNALTGPLTVTAPGGVGVSTRILQVLGPAPLVKAFTPASGAPGTTVRVYGINFSRATTVRFNSVATTGFQVLSDTNLTVTVPPTATTGQITVVNPFGSGSSTAAFVVGTTADISVGMTANLNPPIIGSDLVLTFSIRNLGPIPAQSPHATFTAPPGTVPVSADAGAGNFNIGGSNVNFTYADLNPGASVGGTITISIPTNQPLALTLTGGSSTPDNIIANNTATLNLTPEALTLSAELVIGGSVHLSWPALTGNYILESAPKLSPAAWTTITNVPDTDGSHDFLNLSATNQHIFFRLRLP